MRPLLCQWELDPDLGSGAFHEYGEFLPHEFRREVLGQHIPRMPLERNTAWEETPPHWFSGRPWTPGYAREFALSVMTLAQLEAQGGIDDVCRQLQVHAGRDWILDIDLDFFATFCPNLSAPIQKHGWTSPAASQTFGQWAVRLRMITSSGIEPACQHDLFEPNTFREHTAREITHLAFLPSAQESRLTREELLARFRAIAPSCNPPTVQLQALAELINGLTEEQRAQWRKLDSADWHSVMQPHGPHHVATCHEIREDARRLEPFLRRLPCPPALVTVARSSEMYLPGEVARAVEWEVLMLIRRVWPPPDSTHLPSELEACRAEHVALALQAVHFHAEEGGERLGPQPWPLLQGPAAIVPDGEATALARSYALVGSWSGWASFDELTRRHAGSSIFEGRVRVPGSCAVEFQVVCDHDWAKRLYPAAASDIVLGPHADCHGRNWWLPASEDAAVLHVLLDPTGHRRLDCSLLPASDEDVGAKGAGPLYPPHLSGLGHVNSNDASIAHIDGGVLYTGDGGASIAAPPHAERGLHHASSGGHAAQHPRVECGPRLLQGGEEGAGIALLPMPARGAREDSIERGNAAHQCRSELQEQSRRRHTSMLFELVD
eukprot:NODE_2034_length_2308_cov_4.265016.p1 GENE.NODE_2034_length_2308_cov_4.265016~~NODE_2034_length_2308_cov_4.265016.p1  ORF type:complete len:704 (-),score=144.67 NODE_2034_length_2308_cov_4.265016:195-2015(-)